ncbi:MAG: bifunctional 2-methylcitrate synthase/citrate synthase [Proteobacteria bacterium]|jgi:2-methylcitrate synthase/citrate synthase II|nr:bifunctional 2-methylcitrate synthase/citrate synthase [Candidatus Fonsibacter sp. PEL4]NBZ97438.1 bifunctional 2-methylcitrate synthase/citrate synthase [Candidatus Fonsibacter sp. PEL4]
MSEVEIKKGLVGVIADETKVSEVMPDINSLTYRGYAVQDLAEACIFEEVAYLLLNGELPNKSQLTKFQEEERNNRGISTNLKKIIQNFPKTANPMDTTRTSVSHLSLEDSETDTNTIEANYNKFIRIFAKTPTAVAANFRTRKELDIIDPKKDLSFSENFFHMCFGKVPSKDVVKAFDVSLILYAEHSFNASTFTSRIIASTLADIHSAIIGGISALKGPLHGGANEAVMEMFFEIKEPENAEKYILNKIKNKDLIIGFGHRVYKKGDSRVPTMTKYYYKTAEFYKNEKFPKISKKLEETMIKEKNIFPNLDFPSGPTYYLMGFDVDFFTPIFVVSRITGWSAHVNEQLKDNRLIRPLSKYTGSVHRKVQPIDKR